MRDPNCTITTLKYPPACLLFQNSHITNNYDALVINEVVYYSIKLTSNFIIPNIRILYFG